MSTPKRIVVEHCNGVAVVTFKDDWMEEDWIVQEVGEQLFALVNDRHKTRIVLDFTGVQFFSAGLMCKIIHMKSLMHRESGSAKMMTCCLQPTLLASWEASKMDVFLQYVPDRATALAQF
jgi:anti-anti-sigma regulatory factor